MARVRRKVKKGSLSPCGKETKMVRLIIIQGRAERVFDAIKNIRLRHPSMTSAQAAQKGLLQPRLQNTVPYEIGKFPEVKLDIGTENN